MELAFVLGSQCWDSTPGKQLTSVCIYAAVPLHAVFFAFVSVETGGRTARKALAGCRGADLPCRRPNSL